MVSALDSRVGRPGSVIEPWLGIFCSWAKHFPLTAPLPTQVYKWIPANLMLGEPCDGLTSHPGGSRNTPSRFMLKKKTG